MLRNFTPHPIHLYDPDGQTLRQVFPSEGVARVQEERTVIGRVADSPLYEIRYGRLDGLPNPAPDVWLIVSAVAAAAAKLLGRTDCLIVADPVRDTNGQPIGCRAFAKH